nr:MAG TPA: hypothetical protein [Caudoviricetes sp.]
MLRKLILTLVADIQKSLRKEFHKFVQVNQNRL